MSYLQITNHHFTLRKIAKEFNPSKYYFTKIYFYLASNMSNITNVMQEFREIKILNTADVLLVCFHEILQSRQQEKIRQLTEKLHTRAVQ